MLIDNKITYDQVLNLEVDINKCIDSLLVLQNYYGIKNLPISDLEQTENMLFSKRLDFDKKQYKKI